MVACSLVSLSVVGESQAKLRPCGRLFALLPHLEPRPQPGRTLEEPLEPRLRPHGRSFACDSPTTLRLTSEHATICSMMLGQWPLLLCPRAPGPASPGEDQIVQLGLDRLALPCLARRHRAITSFGMRTWPATRGYRERNDSPGQAFSTLCRPCLPVICDVCI